MNNQPTQVQVSAYDTAVNDSQKFFWAAIFFQSPLAIGLLFLSFGFVHEIGIMTNPVGFICGSILILVATAIGMFGFFGGVFWLINWVMFIPFAIYVIYGDFNSILGPGEALARWAITLDGKTLSALQWFEVSFGETASGFLALGILLTVVILPIWGLGKLAKMAKK